jgi:hypothetical protein
MANTMSDTTSTITWNQRNKWPITARFGHSYTN